MKKLLFLAMVLGLFMVGTARADGVWVLWESQYLSSDNKILNSGEWEIVSAYPTYELCLQRQKSTFLTRDNILASDKKRIYYLEVEILRSDPYEFTSLIIRMKNGEKHFLQQQLRCLPESLDPRK